MNYSIHDIKTTKECDTLLKTAEDKKTDIEIRSYKKRKIYNSKLKKILSIGARKMEVMEEINSFEAAVAHLPQGALKDDLQHRLVKLNHKKYMLERAEKSHTWPAIVRHQYSINTLLRLNQAVEDLITAVSLRRAVLSEKY